MESKKVSRDKWKTRFRLHLCMPKGTTGGTIPNHQRERQELDGVCDSGLWSNNARMRLHTGQVMKRIEYVLCIHWWWDWGLLEVIGCIHWLKEGGMPVGLGKEWQVTGNLVMGEWENECEGGKSGTQVGVWWISEIEVHHGYDKLVLKTWTEVITLEGTELEVIVLVCTLTQSMVPLFILSI